MIFGSLGAAGAAEGFRFEYDIAPRLAKLGCAAAECHGGATGRGGFKLSLFATDPRADYEAIVHELGGRRVDLLEAEASLVLRKPTRAVEHEGGRVIERGSEEHRALVAWIGRGAPYAEGECGELRELEAVLEDGRMQVRASFGDGASPAWRDVTGMARFETTDAAVVAVDEEGRVEVAGAGEAWVVAQYGGLTARAVVREGFGGEVAAEGDGLDGVWLERLAALGLEPAPAAARHVVLRRLTHDLAGRPPTVEEVERFATLGVEGTVAKLLGAGAFERQVERFVGEWFEVPGLDEDLRHTKDRNDGMRAAVRAFAASGGGMDAWVRSVFEEAEAGVLLRRFADPRDRAEYVGRTMLGMGIGCARCHNHPGDRWTQAQHLQFSALFAERRGGARPAGGEAMMAGAFYLPGDGKAVAPALLPIGGEALAVGGGSRDEVLGRFVLEHGREVFARNVANRVFGWLFGAHLVEAPDDHRAGNPAVHEAVLEYLAGRFVEGGMRIGPLVEEIVTSRWYAVSSEPAEDSGAGRAYLARREPRVLEGAAYLRAVGSVLDVEVRAGAAETPLASALQVLNSGVLERALAEPGNQVDAVFDFEVDPGRQLEALFRLLLARSPRDEERAAFLPLLREDGRGAGRDLAFALLAGREFSSVR